MDILSDVSVSGNLSANRLSADRLDVNNTYTDVINLTNKNGYDQAIIVCGDRVIDFNIGGVNINDRGGGVRICGSSLYFITKDGDYSAVGLRLTEFETECKKRFIMQGTDEYHIDSSLYVFGTLCVAGKANFRNGIVTSRIVVEDDHLMYSMTKSLTIPANCSKFHIVTNDDNFLSPLPYLATMYNGDGFNKNVNVDYLFDMCNLIGIVTPSGESRNMTFKILQQK